MQKTLIALAVLALSAAVQAAPADEGVPLHPINDGRYTVISSNIPATALPCKAAPISRWLSNTPFVPNWVIDISILMRKPMAKNSSTVPKPIM